MITAREKMFPREQQMNYLCAWYVRNLSSIDVISIPILISHTHRNMSINVKYVIKLCNKILIKKTHDRTKQRNSDW